MGVTSCSFSGTELRPSPPRVRYHDMMRSRPSIAIYVLALAGLIGLTSTLAAQGTYTLRFVPGSRAAAVLDSIGFRQNPLRAGWRPASSAQAKIRAAGASPAAVSAADQRYSERQADRLTADFIPFESVDADEGLVAIRGVVPASFWTGIPGVLAVGEGSAVFPKGGLPNDPTFVDQWNLERIEAAGAWNYTTGGFTPSGRQIVIGVIEANGFDLAHPELVDQYYRNPGEIPGNGIDDDRNGYVDDVSGVNFTRRTTTFVPDPHGVQVSGVLAAQSNNGAQSTGLNWKAKLLPFQVDSVYKWALALDYLTVLRTRYNQTDGREGAYVVVANCSLGNSANCSSPFNAELNAAIDRAGRAGILVVGAVGNQTDDADRQTDLPASCVSDFLLMVTSSDREDQITPGAGFSQRQVDVSAPGESFGGLDYQIFGRNDNTFAGTSGATPQVAGVVALMYAAMCERLEVASVTSPGSVAALVKSLILENVDVIASQVSRVSSGGRLNARRAVGALQIAEACDAVDFVVGFDEGTAAPSRLESTGGALLFAETLSESWNLHRYRAEQTLPIDADLVRAVPPVRLAVENMRLVSTGRAYGFGGSRDYLAEIAQAGALEFVSSAAGLDTDASTAAVFEVGFDESRLVTSGSELNPFAPSIGIGGAALAAIAGETAGLTGNAEVLRFRGYRLSDWVSAADGAAGARRSYDQSLGATGRPVAVFASGLEGMLRDRRQARPGAVVQLVLRRLLASGIVPVLPQDGLSSTSRPPAELPSGWLVAQGYGQEGFGAPYATVLAPDRGLAFGGNRRTCRVSGDLAAVAQVAGAVALLDRLDCPSLDRATAAQRSSATVAALLDKDPAGAPRTSLDMVLAARLLSAKCAGEEAVRTPLVNVFPNPLGEQRELRVVYTAENAGEFSVYDMAGRRVLRHTFESPFMGIGQARLNLGGLAAGVYVLRIVIGERTGSQQIVVL